MESDRNRIGGNRDRDLAGRLLQERLRSQTPGECHSVKTQNLDKGDKDLLVRLGGQNGRC